MFRRLTTTLVCAAALVVAAVLAGCAAVHGMGRPHGPVLPPSTAAIRTFAHVTHGGDKPEALLQSKAAHRIGHPANKCRHNPSAQLVLVSIEAQHEWLCAHHHLVFSTPVTTGASAHGDATPRGTFSIQGVQRNTVLHPSSGGAYHVKYWIPFRAPLYGFHDASWQKIAYGSGRYRTKGSHGCVHMPLNAIKFLAGWAHIGARVRIA